MLGNSIKNALVLGQSKIFLIAQVLFCQYIGVADIGCILAGLLLLASLGVGGEGGLSRAAHKLLLVFVGLIFATSAFSRIIGPDGTSIVDLFELMAEFLLCIQAIELLRTQPIGSCAQMQSNYLPGLGALTVVLVLVSREVPLSLSGINATFSALTLLLLAVLRPDLWALLRRSGAERQKGLSLLFAMAVAVTTGILFQGEITRQLPALQILVRNFNLPGQFTDRVLVQSQTQFVEQVDLENVSPAQLANPEAMVFRVESQAPPGYMRTLSFDTFDGNRWSNRFRTFGRGEGFRIQVVSPWDGSLPASIKRPTDTNVELFKMHCSDESPIQELRVIVPPGSGRLVPLPLAPMYLLAESDARANQLVLDVHGNPRPNGINNRSYQVIYGERDRYPHDEEYLQGLLAVPQDDLIYFRELSDKICSNAQTIKDKLGCIEQYFVQNFEYEFPSAGQPIEIAQSKLKSFLEKRRASHCEYFATAAAMLLRAQGVLCRVSTGYVVTEMNLEKEYFFARNRDAHAWVEVYDESSEEWIVVEATPPVRSRIQEIRLKRATSSSQMASAIGEDQSTTASIFGGLEAISAWILRLLAWRYAWAFPITFATITFLIKVPFKTLSSKSRAISRDVVIQDRLAAKYGFVRSSSETCLQFARRLALSSVPQMADLANWYYDHSKKRYIP